MTYAASIPISEPSDGQVVWGGCCHAGDENCRPTAPIPWLRLAVGLFVAAQTMTLAIAINHTPPEDHSVKLALQIGMLAATVLVMVLLGWPLASEAVRQALQRRVTMEALFVLCLAGTFGLSCVSLATGEGPVYFEVVSILLIVYSVGRAISTHSRAKALSTLRDLTDTLSVARQVVEINGREEQRTVDVSELVEGQQVRVLPGELIPVDGRVLKGQSFVRETAFTGEWIPQRRGPGNSVIAGTLSEDGALLLEVTKTGGRRQFDDLAMLIEQARQSPASLQRQADRFVAWFLPTVMIVAIATAAFWLWWAGLQTALMCSLAVLLVACPCAAGLATPLVLWSVIGQLARRGLVVRSGETIERLAAADSVIFDKTGTLGDQRLRVEAIELPEDNCQRRTVLAAIAAVERHSDHPVARALQALDAEADGPEVDVQWCRTLPGQGVTSEVRFPSSGPRSEPTMRTVTIARDTEGTEDPGTRIAVTIDDQPVAKFAIHEQLRDSASEAVTQLDRLGLGVRIMTGDGWAGARHVSDLAPTSASMSPESKYEAVMTLRRGDDGYARPVFVGDGLNDAAAMAASYTSIAIASGSDVAMEAAAATLHGDDLQLVPEAVRLARRAVWAVRTNLLWAVSYNLVGMTLAATGLLDPVLAAVLMAASSVLVSWRSFRVTDGLPADTWQQPETIGRPDLQAAGKPADAVGAAADTRAVTHKKVLHWLGMIGQAVLLIIVARLGAVSSLAILLAFVLLTWVALRWWHRMPHWMDMTFAMVTLGGFGMNLGWWADLGFQDAVTPAVVEGQQAAGSCCPDPGGASTVGSAHRGCHSTRSVMTWMNFGMLLLGVPAMFWACYRRQPWSWRRWCCTGMLVLGVPGMVVGMMAGAILAMQLFPNVEPSAMVVLHYVFMMVGMCVGMLLPHMLEYLVPVGDRTGDNV